LVLRDPTSRLETGRRIGRSSASSASTEPERPNEDRIAAAALSVLA
jgi:hypothetical protein